MVAADRSQVQVYKRNDNRWEARYIKSYHQDGRPLLGSVYGKTREEAIRKRKIVLGETNIEKTPSRLNLLILGAGSHGRDVKEIAQTLRVFHKISFLDDTATGEDIIGKCKDALNFQNEYTCAFVAIGDNKKRKKWTQFLKERNFLIPSIIAPSATISPDAKIGEGVAILPQSTISESVIGDFCILAPNSVVNNGARVGSFSRIDCGGIVKKEVSVPDGTWVKTGKVYSGGRKNSNAEMQIQDITNSTFEAGSTCV